MSHSTQEGLRSRPVFHQVFLSLSLCNGGPLIRRCPFGKWIDKCDNVTRGHWFGDLITLPGQLKCIWLNRFSYLFIRYFKVFTQ